MKDAILNLAVEVKVKKKTSNWSNAKEQVKDSQVIYIFGELFGGIYPHPDVKDIGAQPIQVFFTRKFDLQK